LLLREGFYSKKYSSNYLRLFENLPGSFYRASNRSNTFYSLSTALYILVVEAEKLAFSGLGAF